MKQPLRTKPGTPFVVYVKRIPWHQRKWVQEAALYVCGMALIAAWLLALR